MRQNTYGWLTLLLILIAAGEGLYFKYSLDVNNEEIRIIQQEIENCRKQRKILVKDINNKTQLSIKLTKNEEFNKIITGFCNDSSYKTIFLFLPENACLDCIQDHILAITNIIEKKDKTSMVILCSRVDYRNNLKFAHSKPFVDVKIINNTALSISKRPFVFHIHAGLVEDLFFINKNFSDFTKASMEALFCKYYELTPTKY